MLTVNMHDAKTRLSELVARAVAGEPFVIARAGKPLVKVEALATTEKSAPRRIGALNGKWVLPDGPGFPEDLSPEDQAELEDLWYNGPLFPDERREDAA